MINFKNYDENDLNAYYVEYVSSINELERDEEIANDLGLSICCEKDLSDMFDEMIDESGFFDEYSRDDYCAINEIFNCWAVGLCREGQISRNMLNDYCYVGKYK